MTTRPPGERQRVITKRRLMVLVIKNCPVCKEELNLFIDTSESPPDEVGTECDCGALPIWKVEWAYRVWVGEYLCDDNDR